MALAQDWDHTNASYWLRATEDQKEACVSNNEMLLAAATVCAAELEVSRSYSFSLMEGNISKMLIVANEQIAGCRQGGQLGITSFSCESTEAHGVTLVGTFALHGSWGLDPASTSLRIIEAIDDIRSFPSSLQLLVRKLGAWPVEIGAQLPELILKSVWAGL